MKQLTFKSILLFVLIIAVSCESLEEEPIGLISPETIFVSPDEVRLGINGGYSYLNYEGFWGRQLPMTLILRGDMVSIGNMGTRPERIQVDQMNMNASNELVADFWIRGFHIFAAVNYAIEGAQDLNLPEDEINPVIAEGRFLRAFVYFHFVRLFGEIPLVDFAFRDLDGAFTFPQSSEEEIYQSIIDDLEFCKQWLPDEQALRTRPGKGTAAGLLASVYLTIGEWQNAYDEAKFVIDNSGVFRYGLEGDYADLFDPSISSASEEVLFELDMIGNDGPTNPTALGGSNAATDFMAPITGPAGDERFGFGAGWSVAVPSMRVFENWDPRDYRRSVSFDTVVMNGGNIVPFTQWAGIDGLTPRPHIAKQYRAVGQALGQGNPAVQAGINGRDTDLDIPLLRYAQVLLIAAEALNELGGPTAESVGYVNMVRSRARRELDNDPGNDSSFPEDLSTGISKEEFTRLILEERRLELSFEGHRWYDIKRRNLGVEAFGTNGLDPQPLFDPAVDYLLPKFQTDVNLSEGLEQNFGY